jgi:hypothetical protein
MISDGIKQSQNPHVSAWRVFCCLKGIRCLRNPEKEPIAYTAFCWCHPLAVVVGDQDDSLAACINLPLLFVASPFEDVLRITLGSMVPAARLSCHGFLAASG